MKFRQRFWRLQNKRTVRICFFFCLQNRIYYVVIWEMEYLLVGLKSHNNWYIWNPASKPSSFPSSLSDVSIFINIRPLIHERYFTCYQPTVVLMVLIDIYSTAHAAIFPQFTFSLNIGKKSTHTTKIVDGNFFIFWSLNSCFKYLSFSLSLSLRKSF